MFNIDLAECQFYRVCVLRHIRLPHHWFSAWSMLPGKNRKISQILARVCTLILDPPESWLPSVSMCITNEIFPMHTAYFHVRMAEFRWNCEPTCTVSWMQGTLRPTMQVEAALSLLAVGFTIYSLAIIVLLSISQCGCLLCQAWAILHLTWLYLFLPTALFEVILYPMHTDRHSWFYYTSKQSAPSQMTLHDSDALLRWWHLTQHATWDQTLVWSTLYTYYM